MKNKTEQFDSLSIWGDKPFREQTKKALTLLRTRVLSLYQKLVLDYLGAIRSFRGKPGIDLNKKVPVFYVNHETAYHSVKWYASAILHDSFHAKQYLDYKGKHKTRVPHKVFYSPKAELEAIAVQIRTAKKLGLPARQIKYLKSLDGTHTWD